MSTLRLSDKEAIEFSPDFIDEDTLRGFLEFGPEALTLAEAEEVSRELRAKMVAERPKKRPPITRPSKEMSLDQVFHTVFDTLEKDEDFGGYVRENRKALELDVEKDFVGRVGRRINPRIFEKNMATFQVDRTVSKGEVTFTINGERALSYRETGLATARASWVDTLFAWCKLIWDTIGFIGSVLEIHTPKATSARVKKITKIIDKAKGVWARFVEKMKRLPYVGRAIQKIEIIVNALGTDIGESAREVAKAMWRGMNWREWLWAVAQFAAAMAALFLTAGAAFINKLVRAAAKLVTVIQDVLDIIRLSGRSTAMQKAVA